MKIKTLLVCFLAVAALSLTSCKKENYAEKFVGNYVATVTPNLTISSSEIGSEAVEAEPIEGIAFTIAQVGETQDVTLTFPIPEFALEDLEITEEELAAMGIELPEAIVLSGTCDETGLHCGGLSFDQTLTLPLYEGMNLDITINLSLGNETIAEPVNNTISWNSAVSGKFIVEIPGMEGMTEESTISGNIQFNATKQ